ncbi:L,D-transpeptidase family protein [Mesorhizobium sp. VK25A]|uniref:L,D-transpeptidase family protein n=1 Tax=Mesorhizobium vachelliae TaxID=3072309 RepID=A0ABU5A076_9HYPH|nr:MULTISPECIES: L,D-transpeptidase family protein [unclassified Mesorhizobium]MDX8531062.1 L,D-transpeptidase family protein [Mesorhizobium sp. VK25D]MDX8543187.1 L,D-transpeptidase family protein [Mesorhizobium sp. VK25A]
MWARISLAICAYLIATSPVREPSIFPAQKIDLVRVEKSRRQLQLISGDKVLRSYSIALGGRPVGHKRQEGDERTPEGRYVLDWRNPNSVAHRSIHISYPNVDDTAAAKARGVDPGGFIMIHGQPNGFGWLGRLLQMVDWTDGCIAVTNADMDEIWTMVADGTPIEIRQ